MSCPCGSNIPYSVCCGPYIEGKKHAPTPEALMRSRYTAYTQNNLDYIEATMCGEALKKFDRRRKPDVEFLKLQVLFCTENGDEGTVQFIATLRSGGKEHIMSEHSHFIKVDGKWYYDQGVVS